VSPTFGDLNYLGVLGDVRQYVPLRPFTLAGRLLQYGRYGKDGEDPRLVDVFLGYPSLVRGYDDNSFSATECDADTCPTFDQLFGSRIAVANFELRLPLLGPASLVPVSGIPPVEVAAFFDAGAAWREGERFPFAGNGARDPVTSHGIAMRLNLLGFAVAELDYVHPNDRPRKGWYWLFSLQPGF
jgi:outer membrane protein assembly factor BamA